ncbi:MAG: OsmC family protein [Bacillota bacterium]
MNKGNMTNGINVTQLNDTLNAIKKTPSIAKCEFRIKNKWISGANSRSTIKDFYAAGQEDTVRTKQFTLEADEPAVLLGTDKAPGAGEYLLQALASCLVTTLIYHAAAQGIKIESVDTEIKGTVDLQGFLGLTKKVRNGFDNIDVKFRIKGDNITDEQKRQLCEMAKNYSPVFDNISNPTRITVGLEEPVAV